MQGPGGDADDGGEEDRGDEGLQDQEAAERQQGDQGDAGESFVVHAGGIVTLRLPPGRPKEA